MNETFPERVARIKEEQNVSIMTARHVAGAEIRIEREIRDRRTRELSDAMHEATK